MDTMIVRGMAMAPSSWKPVAIQSAWNTDIKIISKDELSGRLAGIACLFLANAVVIALLALLSFQLFEWTLYQPAIWCNFALNGIGITQWCYVSRIRNWFKKKGQLKVARGVTGGAEITFVLTIAWFIFILSGVWI